MEVYVLHATYRGGMDYVGTFASFEAADAWMTRNKPEHTRTEYDRAAEQWKYIRPDDGTPMESARELRKLDVFVVTLDTLRTSGAPLPSRG